MVQEVQTQGNRYQEPNLIPWVWISERKVKEHVQVTQSFWYECVVSGSVGMSADSDHRQSDPQRITLTLGSQYWNTEFIAIDGKLRIPLAWAYLAEIKLRGGSAQATVTQKIKIWKKVLVTQATNDNIDSTVVTKVLNLWRYDLLEVWADLYRAWSGGYSSTAYFTMKLIKL